MKSVCAFGRKAPLLAARPEAESRQVPRSEPDQRLQHLVARSGLMGTGVEEGEQPGPSVGVQERDDHGQAGEDPEDLHHRTHRHAAAERAARG